MRARLTVEAGPAEPREVELSPETVVRLGRYRTNTIFLKDEHVSRFHAEVFFDRGAWYVRDCGAINKTRLDGVRIRQPTRLGPGQVIGIGSIAIRFDADRTGWETPEPQERTPVDEPRLVSVPPAEPGSTRLDPDGLTALFQFMNASLAEPSPHGLVTLGLRTVQKQTGAGVCGFQSFDAEDAELKVVLPAGAAVNAPLSRQLTQKVRDEGCPAWLSAPAAGDDDGIHSVSLAAYRDAVCVPLRRPPADRGGPADPLLGALHAYHAERRFTEREVRFCEVLAGWLANALVAVRSRRVLQADNDRLREHAGRGDELVGGSATLRRLREDIARLACIARPVLIEGESGVGKELVALALHRQNPRRKGPLVTVNCAALTRGLTEAELFGHPKGAFTDAKTARPGLWVQADEGTLFLDEIGELSPENQARLLRVLEDNHVRPVMGDSEVKVDVRVVAATNRDLKREVRAGRFREDLYFRLAACLRVPPLRKHAEDIPALADHFLRKLSLEFGRQVRLAPEALERLVDYPWPGNVRQLRSVLETAVAMTSADELRPADLRLDGDGSGLSAGPASLNLEHLEARAIREALARTGGVHVQAAKLLGIHRETLLNKIKRYGLDRDTPEDPTP